MKYGSSTVARPFASVRTMSLVSRMLLLNAYCASGPVDNWRPIPASGARVALSRTITLMPWCSMPDCEFAPATWVGRETTCAGARTAARGSASRSVGGAGAEDDVSGDGSTIDGSCCGVRSDHHIKATTV